MLDRRFLRSPISHVLRRSLCAIAAAAVVALASPSARAFDLSVSHWGEDMYGAPWAVALKKGFFKEHGVDVTGIVGSNGGGTTVRNMLASEFPYAETALSAAVAAIAEGVDLKLVDGAVNNAADMVWVAKAGSPLNSIHDLKGKTIAYTRAKSTSDLLSTLSIQAAGMKLSDIKRVAIGGLGPGLTALEHGAVDATVIVEPVYAQSAGKYKVVFSVADLCPPMTQHVGVVRADFAKSHGDQIRAIIAARREGVLYMRAHPEEAARITAEAYDMAPGPIEQALKRLLAAHYWSEGEFDYAAMDRLVAGLALLGVTKQAKVDWTKIVDNSYLPKDLRKPIPAMN